MTLTKTFLFLILTQICHSSYLASYNDLDYYDVSSQEQGNYQRVLKTAQVWYRCSNLPCYLRLLLLLWGSSSLLQLMWTSAAIEIHLFLPILFGPGSKARHA